MKPKIEDLIGLSHTKLDFFKEVQTKIGELQRSNLELERKRRQVQAILDGIADIVAVVAPDYRIRAINNSYHTFYDVADPVDAFCYTIFRGRKTPCPVCPLRDAEGAPGDIIVVKRDMTLEKEYQAKYYHAEKMATIGLLAAGVAHEINNPLAAISGFTQGLKRRLPKLEQMVADEALKEDYREYLDVIQKECQRCRDIVRSLLTFSPRQHTEFCRVDLNSLVDNVMRLLQHRMKQYPPETIRLALDTGLPVIRGNPPELEQVILNLVLNALDAVGSETGEITPRTRSKSRNRVVLEVVDNGRGIDADHMQKLFEPFFTTKPLGQGIGIGLSTCYTIIQAHGGEIAVDSAPGKGAVFTVILPQYSNSAESL